MHQLIPWLSTDVLKFFITAQINARKLHENRGMKLSKLVNIIHEFLQMKSLSHRSKRQSFYESNAIRVNTSLYIS